MDYRNNEQGLMQLLQKLEYVQGTFPPVYMLDGVLIGYDKLERIRVIGDVESEAGQLESSQIIPRSGRLPGQLSIQ